MQRVKPKIARLTLPTVVIQGAVVLIAGWILASAVSTLRMSMALGVVLGGGFLLLFLVQPASAMLLVLLARASTDLTLRFLPSYGPQSEFIGGLPNIMLILILTGAGGVYVLSRRVPWISLPGGRLLIILLLTGLVGVVRTGDVLHSMNEWVPVLASFITYALAAHLFSSPKGIQRAVDVISASFIIPGALGLYQLSAGIGVRRAEFGIPGIVGTFGHPNTFGFHLVILSAVFAGQALVHTGRRRAVAVAALCLALVLLIATYARVAWAGMLVVFLVIAIVRARALLFLLPAGALITLWLVPAVGQRIANPLASGGSLGDRLFNLWPATLRAWLSATGAEGGGFVVAVNRLAGLGPGVGPALARFGLGGVPHNDYLRVLVEYGIFGLILQFVLSAVLAMTAFRAWRECKDGKAPEAAAVVLSFLALALAFPVMSITDNIFAHTSNQVYFWTLAGLTIAAGRWQRQDSQDMLASTGIGRQREL